MVWIYRDNFEWLIFLAFLEFNDRLNIKRRINFNFFPLDAEKNPRGGNC